MSEREQREHREEGGDSQTATSREGETMGEAHGDLGQEGAPTPPGAGHPNVGEGVGMPEEGPGRANMDATPPMSTEDQGEATLDEKER